MYGAILTILVGLFLAFYGLCLLGWPIDVAKGIGLLERRSPRMRAAIGLLLIGVGLVAAIAQGAWLLR